jgi:hypothetical protein
MELQICISLSILLDHFKECIPFFECHMVHGTYHSMQPFLLLCRCIKRVQTSIITAEQYQSSLFRNKNKISGSYQIPSQSERNFSYKVEQIHEIDITLIARN